MSDRRRFLKGLTSLPLATVLANFRLAAAVSAGLQEVEAKLADGRTVKAALAKPERQANGSILLTSHWILVVMDQFTRRIIGVGVHTGTVDGMVLCRMFNHAIAGQGAPRHLSSDHDPLFEYHRWQANLRVLDVEEIKTVPYVPLSHPFVERLIGTIRREFLDQTLFWNSVDLESKLLEFRDYYNRERVHSGIGGSTPCGALTAGVAKLDNFRWQACCRGLYQLPVAA